MTDNLRAHVEELFKNAPRTKQTVEIKEEILQNTIDRYNDLIAEGKSEQAAFNISVAGIGDIEHLIEDIVVPGGQYTREEIEKNKRRNAILLAVSVMLYILCIVPLIIIDELGGNEVIGLVLMFTLAAVATGIIIYRSGTTLHYSKNDDTIVENFKEWNNKKDEDSSLMNAVYSAIWTLTLIIYFIISFITGAWYITWLIFFIGGVVVNIIKAIIDLRG